MSSSRRPIDRGTDLVLARPGIEKRGEARWSTIPPLGLAYLAAIARQRGLSVAVVDGRMLGHRSVAETARAILAHRPAVVGLSAMTVDFPAAASIARAVKDADPAVTTMLGGPHANALPLESLREAAGFDMVLAGEAFFELADVVRATLDGSPRGLVPGLCWREGDALHGPNGAAFISEPDMARLPRPAWDLFPPIDSHPVMTQLGCPYACVFCSHNSTRSTRYRPVDQVLDEIAWLRDERAARSITFIDENFGLKRSRTLELLDGLARANPNGHLRYSAQTRIDCISESLVAGMKAAGFDCIELGVESGDAEVLSRSGKGIRLDMLEAAVGLARRAGLKVWLKFILGLPGENRDTLRSTIELSVRLNPDRLSVATIVPYPGSEVFEWARRGERGYRLVSTDWRDFDKYMGDCMTLDGLSSRALRWAQARMYLETYLRNGRLRDLTGMVLRNRSLVGSYLAGVVGPRHGG